jgi:hypothetical protein
MKKRINLFIKKKSSPTSALASEKVNFYGSIVGVILFAVFLGFIFLRYQVQAGKNSLLQEKQNLYDFILANKDEVAKMNLYTKKNSQLKTFLKDDAEFLPYYNLLKDALSKNDTANFNPALDYMQIDKDKNTEFSVKFADYEPAYKFLKIMESEEFLNNFIELKLIGFTLTNSIKTADEQKGYVLQFKGKFKSIDGR